MLGKAFRFILAAIVIVVIGLGILYIAVLNDAIEALLKAVAGIMILLIFAVLAKYIAGILSRMLHGSGGAFIWGFIQLTVLAVLIDSAGKYALGYQPLFFYVFDYWPLSELRIPLWTIIGEGYPYIGDAIGILFYAGIARFFTRRSKPNKGTLTA